MTTEILNTWKEIAAYLKVSVDYAKTLAERNSDFPLFREKGKRGNSSRVFTTSRALAGWVENKAKPPRQTTPEHI